MTRLSIYSDRLHIRHLSLSDLSDFHLYRSNPEVTKYQGFDIFSFQEAKVFIEEHAERMFGKPGEWVQYGIENKTTNKLIGDCAIKLDIYDTRLAEVGITISPNEQRKGYAREALLGILKFLFNLKDFHRVTEIVDAENIASIQLLKSVGFRQEGHFIENIFFKGKWGSEFKYAMLRTDWENVTKK